jgi:hypothetical protein
MTLLNTYSAGSDYLLYTNSGTIFMAIFPPYCGTASVAK